MTEGASPRVQEDTIKFARIMEGLGTSLIDSCNDFVAFVPILFGTFKKVLIPIPFLGEVNTV